MSVWHWYRPDRTVRSAVSFRYRLLAQPSNPCQRIRLGIVSQTLILWLAHRTEQIYAVAFPVNWLESTVLKMQKKNITGVTFPNKTKTHNVTKQTGNKINRKQFFVFNLNLNTSLGSFDFERMLVRTVRRDHQCYTHFFRWTQKKPCLRLTWSELQAVSSQPSKRNVFPCWRMSLFSTLLTLKPQRMTNIKWYWWLIDARITYLHLNFLLTNLFIFEK